MIKLGTLGPDGTYSSEAALKYIREYLQDEEVKVIFYPRIADIFLGLEQNNLDRILVPFENTIAGRVTDTANELIKYNCLTIGEVNLPITIQFAVNRSTNLSEIKYVRSKKEALRQCTNFLSKLEIELVEEPSTAGAAEKIKGKLDSGTVCPRRAAELYDLEIIAENIQNEKDVSTIFKVLKRNN